MTGVGVASEDEMTAPGVYSDNRKPRLLADKDLRMIQNDTDCMQAASHLEKNSFHTQSEGLDSRIGTLFT
jgi:hypothetical protein